MVNESFGYIVRRPECGIILGEHEILAVTDTLEEAEELVKKYEREDEEMMSEWTEDDGTLTYPNGFKYDDPLYEIVSIHGEVIRKGVY